MASLREWLMRLAGSLRPRRSDEDLEEELRFHRDSTPSHARPHTSNLSLTLELLRDQRGLPWLDDARRDVRQSLRTFARMRGFTAIAVVTLALGIAASTVMFSMLNALVLRPLPYRDPATVVVLWTDDQKRQLHETPVPYPLYVEWQERSRSFSTVGFTTLNTPITLTTFGDAERLDAVRASATMFEVLGVSPLAGHPYTSDDERSGGRVVVIGRGLAERRFGSATAALGQVLHLDGEPTTVVGVMPAWFGFPAREVQLWRPLGERRGRVVVVARLRDGTTLEQAHREMIGIGNQLAEAHPALATNPDFPGFASNLVPLQDHVTGRERRVELWLLFGAALLMMCIACTNVGTLLLARAAARRRELAVRVAIGATRARLVRQTLIESAVLATTSAALGVAAAFWILRLLVALSPRDLSRSDDVGIDGSVLVFTIALAVACTITLAALTAWRTERHDLDDVLRDGGRSQGASGGRRGVQRLLIVGELAATLMLVCGAGLALRSLGELRRAPLGFETTDTLMFRMVVANDFSSARRQQFFDEAVNRVTRLPGVRSAGVIGNLFITSAPNATIRMQGAADASTTHVAVLDDVVSPALLAALRVPLRGGRLFTDADTNLSAPVAIVNEAFVREFCGDREPLGRRFQFLDKRFGESWITVVGVVGDMRRERLEHAPSPQVFLPFAQLPSRGADLVVRADVAPLSLAGSVIRAIAAIDASVPVYRVSTVEHRVDDFLINRRFQVTWLSFFATVAVALAAIGVYGLLRHDVTQRTQEIGVRMALGASRHDIITLVLKDCLILTGTGLFIGLVAAMALARLMQTVVYGISIRDPFTFVLAPFILSATAFVACLEPAWRALRIDPLRALR